ncbi:MAG: RDD family protein [Acidimicrobiaceae bacterium]|nr:RDD family protein [Acidimicrobiaceae bacterium]
MARQIPGMNRLVGTFVNPVVNSLDVDAIVQNVDVDELLERVDVQRIVDRVDVDAVVDRVDINRLLGRLDIDGLMRRIDVDALAQRIDVDKLLDDVDVARLVERARVADVVSGSAGAMALSALNLARQQLVTIDTLICYAAVRGVRRLRVPEPDNGLLTGKPAGPFTRFLAFVIDTFVTAAVFSLSVAMISYLAGLFTHHSYHPQSEGFWWAIVGSSIGILYLWTAVALWGQTVGMALLGLRVIHYGGGRVRGSAAFVRALVLPLSFILGLGLIEIVFGRERRALHDHLAGTQMVYDWGGRNAQLPAGITAWIISRQQLVGVASGDGAAAGQAG